MQSIENKISVVVPVYGAVESLQELVERVQSALKKITNDFEILLVDDCGPGESWGTIKELRMENDRIVGIRLSRNFGQHYAITAGLDSASGEWVVIMDCDLQDVPEEIPNIYHKALEGYDVVLASRSERQDSFFKRASSNAFYKVLSYLTGVEYDSTVANYGIYHKKVINAIVSMRESVRYLPAMVKWVGFKCTSIQVKHAPRGVGKSSYNFQRLLRLALDIILAYSDKPIRLTVKLGVIISFSSLIFAVITIVRYFLGEISVVGYASLIVSVWFLAGIIIAILGVIGLYLGKTFEGVKKRPIYIVDEII